MAGGDGPLRDAAIVFVTLLGGAVHTAHVPLVLGLARHLGDEPMKLYFNPQSRAVYSTSQLEPSMGDRLMKVETLPQRGWTDFDTAMNVVEGELGKGPYLFGDWFTAADVMIGSMFIWMRIWGVPTGRPTIDAYVERLLTRPHGMKMGG